MESQNNHLYTEGDINVTDQRQRWNTSLDVKTQGILSRDAHHFLHQALSTPCLDVAASGNGIGFTNLQGKTYIDFHGNNVHQLGYGNAYIIDRVKAQLDVLAFSPRRFTNVPAIELAERLSDLTSNSLSRTLFAPGGTSAVSMALKLARIATGKFKTVSMYDAFHGASMDSISVGGEYVFQQGLGPLLTGSIHVPPVDSYRGIWRTAKQPNDLIYADYIEYVIEKEGNVGALLAETIRSTTVHVPSKQYWQRVRQICDKHGVLLILDEIPIALGRTGAMFAYEHYGILPDILVLGKGLGAGIIPMAAILCNESLNLAGEVSLGHFTHEKNPLGAVAALGALDYMVERDIIGHVQQLELVMRSRLGDMQARHAAIGDIRGIGLLWGVELVSNRDTKSADPALAERVLYRCLENGLSLKVSGGNVLSLYPPLIIAADQLLAALDILEEALTKVTPA